MLKLILSDFFFLPSYISLSMYIYIYIFLFFFFFFLFLAPSLRNFLLLVCYTTLSIEMLFFSIWVPILSLSFSLFHFFLSVCLCVRISFYKTPKWMICCVCSSFFLFSDLIMFICYCSSLCVSSWTWFLYLFCFIRYFIYLFFIFCAFFLSEKKSLRLSVSYRVFFHGIFIFCFKSW